MKKVNKEDIYIELAERYGWMPDEVADINPHQQLVFYRGRKFRTMTPEEYQEFLLTRKRI